MAKNNLREHDHSNPANGGEVMNPDEMHVQSALTVGGVEVSGGVPTGAIMMWSGAIAEVPEGYTLCDGTDGTPDLQDRFIVGAGNSYAVDDTGGADEVTLTEDELPSHSHTYTETTDGTGAGSGGTYDAADATTENTSTVGSGQAHENRPPYYSLAYIMKV